MKLTKEHIAQKFICPHRRQVDPKDFFLLAGFFSKGFASTNMVYGIGSFTYQYVTRDTFGFAMKATYGVVNGVPSEIFKKPKTDDGLKNSAKGLLSVRNINGKITLLESVDQYEENNGMLETVFLDGKLIIDQNLNQIRDQLHCVTS